MKGVVFLLVVLAICIQSLPVGENTQRFRQMSLQSQESQTSTEIQAISARIAFLQKLNKLTYDTTLFTRKLRWLLKRSLTEKPTVAEVAELMQKELEISKAQIEVAVEGVADELKLEVKQGIIALKAGLAFIEDNYKAGSDPEADAIIARIKANLAALEARFGKKTGTPVEVSTAEPVPEPTPSSTAEEVPPESSTVEVPPVESSTVEVPPPEPSSTAEVPPTESSTAEAPAVESSSTAGSLIGSETVVSTGEAPAAESSTVAEVPPAESSTATEVPPAESSTSSEVPAAASSTAETPVETSTAEAVFESSSSTGVNGTNSTDSSSTGDSLLAESPLSATSDAAVSA